MFVLRIFIISVLLITSSCNDNIIDSCNVQVGEQRFDFPDAFASLQSVFGITGNSKTEGYNFIYEDDGKEMIVSINPYGPFTYKNREDEIQFRQDIFNSKGNFKTYVKEKFNDNEIEIFSPVNRKLYFVFSKLNNSNYEYLAICDNYKYENCTYNGHYKDILISFDYERMNYSEFKALEDKIIMRLDEYSC